MSSYPRQGDPRVKLEWANDHIGQLDRRIVEFVNGGACKIVEETDAQTGEAVTRVNFTIPLPTDIPCLAGDILHNLRAALDHLMYRLLPPTTDVQEQRRRAFPIGRDGQHYQNGERSRRMQALRPDLTQRIDQMEPYQGGRGHAIWQLHELNVIDKHRLLLTVGLASHHVWRLPTLSPVGIGIFRRRSKTVVLEHRASVPDSLVEPRTGNATITIAINEPSIVPVRPLVPALKDFSASSKASSPCLTTFRDS